MKSLKWYTRTAGREICPVCKGGGKILRPIRGSQYIAARQCDPCDGYGCVPIVKLRRPELDANYPALAPNKGPEDE